MHRAIERLPVKDFPPDIHELILGMGHRGEEGKSIGGKPLIFIFHLFVFIKLQEYIRPYP